jgi:hypothetical protein
VNEKTRGQTEPPVSPWLWQGSVGLLATVALIALGLVVALALGWRTPTPRRVPDWTATGSDWCEYGYGSAELAEVGSAELAEVGPAELAEVGVASVTDGGYRLRLSQPDQRAWAVAGQQVADFDLELDARSLIASEDVGYGLLYRYQNPANHYLFAVGGDGYYTIAVVLEGTLTPLRAWQGWPHVRRGAATNRLRVRCEDAVCRFFINGEFAAEVIDDTFLAGDLGLWSQTFSDDALDVVFEKVRLWLLSRHPSVARWG